MEIIDETEVYEPKECYFAIIPDSSDESIPLICITNIDFWNEHKCLSDIFGEQSFKDGVIPDIISPEMEAIWSSEAGFVETREAMLNAGFVECPEMEKMAGLY